MIPALAAVCVATGLAIIVLALLWPQRPSEREIGRQLASERDDLILRGVNPDDLERPL